MTQTLINLFDKLSETAKIIADSLSELDTYAEIDYVVYFGDYGGKISRIVFYNGASMTTPTSDRYMFELKLTEKKTYITFGKQSVVLDIDSKSTKVLSELCEVAETYITEYLRKK